MMDILKFRGVKFLFRVCMDINTHSHHLYLEASPSSEPGETSAAQTRATRSRTAHSSAHTPQNMCHPLTLGILKFQVPSRTFHLELLHKLDVLTWESPIKLKLNIQDGRTRLKAVLQLFVSISANKHTQCCPTCGCVFGLAKYYVMCRYEPVLLKLANG